MASQIMTKPNYQHGIVGLFTFFILAVLGWKMILPPTWWEHISYIFFGLNADAATSGFASRAAYYGHFPLQAWGVILGFAVSCMVAGWFGWYVSARPQIAERHVSGIEVWEGKHGRRMMQAVECKQFSKLQKKRKAKGIKVGGIELSFTRETGHISIIGLPGGGKTVLLNGWVLQVLERMEKLILHDPKGDFTAWLPSNKQRSFIIFGPWDKRSKWWDIAEDVRTPALADSFAKALFPDGKNPNDFWTTSPREVCAGIIKYLQKTHAPYVPDAPKWSWDSLAAVIHSGPENVIKIAHQGDPTIKLLVPEEKAKGGDDKKQEQNKTSQGIMASMAANFGWIPVYAACYDLRNEDGSLKKGGFAVTKWLAGKYPKHPTLILKNDKRYEMRGQQIFSAFMAVASNYICSAAMPEIKAEEKGTWVILDEYPQLGPGLGAQIQPIEELGRSRGVRVVKASQDASQLYEQYGKDKGRAQQSVQQTRIYAMTALETAAEVAKIFGDRTVEKLSRSVSGGGGSRSKSWSWSEQRIPVLDPAELAGLGLVLDKGVLERIFGFLRLKKLEKQFAKEKGAEIIINFKDKILKTVAQFPDADMVKPVRPQVVENEKWDYGVFELEKTIAKLQAGMGIDQPSASTQPPVDIDQLGGATVD